MVRTRREFLGLGMASAAGLLSGCGPASTRQTSPPASPPPTPAASLPPPISAERYARRREEVAARMRKEGLHFLLVTPGANLSYLTGAFVGRSERLIALVMSKDAVCRCLGPAFEAERLSRSGLPGELRTWEETEDPVPFLAEMLSTSGPSPRLAVEGTTWFDTLEPLARWLPAARITSATPLLSPFRMKKDPEEIALMQAAIGITLEAIHRVMEEVREGRTEEELLGRAAEIASSRGASLEGTVQFGPTSAIPHAAAGRRRLRASDVVLFDLVADVRGYHADLSRTFAFGAVPRRFQEVYRVVKTAQSEGIRAARVGVPAGTVDGAARSVIHKSGFGKYFTHRLGHGLGLEGHEAPYLVGGSDLLLEEGMTVTVEPGVYLPGEFGVRLEDDILVTADGAVVLSSEEARPAG